MGALIRLVMSMGGAFARFFAAMRATKWAQWLWFYLFTFLGGLVGKLFTLIGVTLAVNTFAMPAITNLIATRLLGLPAVWVQYLALTNIDKATTIILSALAISVADRVYVARRRASWQTPL